MQLVETEPRAAHGGSSWTVTLQNLSSFQSMSWLRFSWELIGGAGRVEGGPLFLNTPDAAAGSTVTATVSLSTEGSSPLLHSGQGGPLFLTVSAHNAAMGTLVKATQFALPRASGGPPLGAGKVGTPLSESESGGGGLRFVAGQGDDGVMALSAACGAVSISFDQTSGELLLFEVDGQSLLASSGGPQHTLWRAPTDNDEGGISVGMPPWLSNVLKRYPNPLWSYAERWRYSGLDRLVSTVLSVTHSVTHNATGRETTDLPTAIDVNLRSFSITLVTELRPPEQGTAAVATTTTLYTVKPDGSIRIDCDVECSAVQCPSVLSRVGLRMRLAPQLQSLAWFGRGPHECYPDRKASAHFGLHRSSVTEQVVPYIVPGESGGKADTIWLALTDDQTGGGLLAVAVPPRREGSQQQHEAVFLSDEKLPSSPSFALFSALPCSAEQLSAAKHTSELGIDIDDIGSEGVIKGPKAAEAVHLTLDHAHMGVGGDVSWLPCVHEPFLIKPAAFSYSMLLIPLRRGQRPEREAARWM